MSCRLTEYLLFIIFLFFVISCVSGHKGINSTSNNKKIKIIPNKVNRFVNKQNNYPCWVVNPPEKCICSKMYNNSFLFSDSIRLKEKKYNKPVKNQLLIKLATNFFFILASKIESQSNFYKKCNYYNNNKIICQTFTGIATEIRTEGYIGLGNIDVVDIYWEKLDYNRWNLYGLGKISNKIFKRMLSFALKNQHKTFIMKE